MDAAGARGVGDRPGWPAQQLIDFFTAVSTADDEESAIREALERATAAFGAEIGVMVGTGGPAAAIGIEPREELTEAVERIHRGETDRLEVPGVGSCRALCTPIGDERLEWLVLARSDRREFTAEERSLAGGMARVLAQTVRLQRVVAAERLLRELSEHRAFHDSLTGLPNRLLLIDRLEHALARAARAGTRAAVLFVDLDTFKNVNDSLGHAAGDELLRMAAKRLVECVRAADTAARFGGDEFVVLLEDVDSDRVARVANRIVETMARPFVIRGREVFIGASIGIAIGGRESDDLLRNADLALYRAKRKGKGQQQVFEPEMHVAMVERLELEESLARALRSGELVLHFQPIMELRSQRLAGVEALVRWQHPSRGLLMPGEFIPIAEDSRLMHPLGRWVLRTACLQAADWRRRHPAARELTLSVNVSGAQFGDSALDESVRETLAESGLPADRLVLELTETALRRDSETVGRRLSELRRQGVRLAVDDFGTNSASLRHLACFPVDVLKVDRSFVERIGIDRRQTAIAGSIIALGQSLELAVVAEGIERPDQLAQLLAHGCGFGQGFYLSPPVDAIALDAMLDRSAPGAEGGSAGAVDPLVSRR